MITIKIKRWRKTTSCPKPRLPWYPLTATCAKCADDIGCPRETTSSCLQPSTRMKRQTSSYEYLRKRKRKWRRLSLVLSVAHWVQSKSFDFECAAWTLWMAVDKLLKLVSGLTWFAHAQSYLSSSHHTSKSQPYNTLTLCYVFTMCLMLIVTIDTVAMEDCLKMYCFIWWYCIVFAFIIKQRWQSAFNKIYH